MSEIRVSAAMTALQQCAIILMWHQEHTPFPFVSAVLITVCVRFSQPACVVGLQQEGRVIQDGCDMSLTF